MVFIHLWARELKYFKMFNMFCAQRTIIVSARILELSSYNEAEIFKFQEAVISLMFLRPEHFSLNYIQGCSTELLD